MWLCLCHLHSQSELTFITRHLFVAIVYTLYPLLGVSSIHAYVGIMEGIPFDIL